MEELSLYSKLDSGRLTMPFLPTRRSRTFEPKLGLVKGGTRGIFKESMSINAGQGPALYLSAIKAWLKRLGYLSGLKILKEREAGVHFSSGILEGDISQGLHLCGAALVDRDCGVMLQRGPESPSCTASSSNLVTFECIQKIPNIVHEGI